MQCADTISSSSGSKRDLACTKITLSCLGFCGADDSIDPWLLHAISCTHNWVEWGVLFREDKRGLPRYASTEWVARLAMANQARKMRLAGHLCSSRVDELLSGDSGFVRKMHEEVGFQRFQINATAANGVNMRAFADEAGAKRCAAALRDVMTALPQVEFIMQRNSQTRPLWELLLEEPPSNMSLLFDESMGLGVSATSWPAPPEGVPFGYAGGLSPVNLAEKLQQIEDTAVGHTLWVDMETSLRTLLADGHDLFDCNKAMRCVRHVIELGLKPEPGAGETHAPHRRRLA